MSVKCQMVVDAIDKIAPQYLAEGWDNVGLLLGNPSQPISKILVALDVTQAVADFAAEHKVDMIISHHPIIFKGLKNLRTDLPHGRVLATLIKADIAVYSAHTNLDISSGGINDILAAKLELINTIPLTTSNADKLIKLVVFVPEDHLESVRTAVTNAGAGHIGNYSHCSFHTNGTGTFLPLLNSKPFIGEQGSLEQTSEVRLETIMPESISRKVLKSMLKAHPYEEAAFDLYPLLNQGSSLGLGRIGYLPVAQTLDQLVNMVKNRLGTSSVNVVGNGDRVIAKVAVCGGSGADLINKSVFAGADVLITGDVKYHEAQDAAAAGIAIIDAGHFATEVIIVDYLAQYLSDRAYEGKWNIEVKADNISKDVFRRC